MYPYVPLCIFLAIFIYASVLLTFATRIISFFLVESQFFLLLPIFLLLCFKELDLTSLFMPFRLPFGNLADSELFSFINEYGILPFSQYSHLVFQAPLSSDGHDEVYNPDSQINTYSDNFTCSYFDLDNEDL